MQNSIPQNYNGITLIDIPDGAGGWMPACIGKIHGTTDEFTVICLHPEKHTNWIMVIKREQARGCTHELTEAMKAIIDARIAEKRAESC